MNRDLQGHSILITSGPTRGNIDAVRFISNRSSGRLGCAIATEALSRGADVTMVTGPDSRRPQKSDMPPAEWERLNIIPVITVSDLLETLENELTSRPPYSAIVHAMAVLDYVPEDEKTSKVRSGRDQWTLRLTRTPKVIRRIKDWSPQSFLVGFKLEVDKDDNQLQLIATDLLDKSRSDLVVANDLNDIRDEEHPALLVGRRGNIIARPQTKSDIAHELCNVLSRVL